MRRPLALIFAVLVFVSCTDVKTEPMSTGRDPSPPAVMFAPDPTAGLVAAAHEQDLQRFYTAVYWQGVGRWAEAVVAREAARTRAVAPVPAPTRTTKTTNLPAAASVADAIAQAFGANAAAATRVAKCESGLDPTAVSPGGGNWGLFQVNTVHRGDFAAITGHPWSDVLDPSVNATFAAWLYGQEGWGPWTCGWAA